MEGRVVNFGIVSGQTCTWIVDEDSLAVGFGASAVACISRDKTVTASSIQTPSVTAPDFAVLACTFQTGRQVILPGVPIYKDEALFVTMSTTGFCSLNLTKVS